MELPLQVTFRHMDPSPAVEDKIEEHARKLRRVYDRVTSCRVVIEAPHKHHHKGRLYHVVVELAVPDGRLVASRERDQHHAHERQQDWQTLPAVLKDQVFLFDGRIPSRHGPRVVDVMEGLAEAMWPQRFSGLALDGVFQRWEG